MRATVDAPTRPGALTEARPAVRLAHGRGSGSRRQGHSSPSCFLALRYRLALTPTLAETYYDEALTGLMALAILHGAPQVFYWGEPYGGAIGDAYPAALAFWLFGPSTLALRMASAVIAVLWAWSVWFIARRAGAGPFAFLAGLLVAVPPVFLSHAQLSTHGESSALAFGTVAMASAAYLIDARGTRCARSGLGDPRHRLGPQLVVEPDRHHGPAPRRRSHRRPATNPSPRRTLRGPRPVLPRELALLGVERAPRVGDVPASRDVGRAAAAVEHSVPDRGRNAPREPARLLLGRTGGAAVVLGADLELDHRAGRVRAGPARRAGAGGRVGQADSGGGNGRGRTLWTWSWSRSGRPWRPTS